MNEEDYLLLSGIQHFAFCRRQWALIHLEDQWVENERTALGRVVHHRAHDESLREKHNDVLIRRGLRVISHTLGVTGNLDVVEFHPVKDGAVLHGQQGFWQPYPIEYKKGEPKEGQEDCLQLCAEAMCLEEMLCCEVPEGALFYDKIKRRVVVQFDGDLRETVRKMFDEMHQLAKRGYTPRVKPKKHCNACSLKPLCVPKLYKYKDVSAYYDACLKEVEDSDAKTP